MDQPLILASSSPRRLELLRQIGVDCEVVPAEIDETPLVNETAVALVERLARAKAQKVADQYSDRTVLAADTVVFLSEPSESIFGKPTDQADALRMLAALSQRSHRVATGIALNRHKSLHSRVVITEVTFAAISPAAALQYWRSGEPLGKAGAYAIQGAGAKFVVSISGSYSNVVGLPLHEVSVWLAQAGQHQGL